MEDVKKSLVIKFLHLSIGISVFLIILFGLMMVFSIIDYYVVSDLATWYDTYFYGILYSLPVSVSFVLFLFPLLLFLSKKIRDYEVNGMDKTTNFIVLLILTVSSAIVIVSLIIVFIGILKGDVSLNYLLKLLSSIIVGSAVFYYYRDILKGSWTENRKKKNGLVIGISFIIIISIIISIVIINPLTRVDLNETYKKLNAIDSTNDALRTYYSKSNMLPKTLSNLSLEEQSYDLYDYDVQIDANDIMYVLTGPRTYMLCADFEEFPRLTELKDYPYSKYNVEKIGENCFDLDVK